MSRTISVALAVSFFGGASIRASDPVGIYALIDRVLFEPAEGLPERVQLMGSFGFAPGMGQGDEYALSRGYLYYSLPKVQEEIARTEWNDLKNVAGTGQGVGFGSRYEPKGTLRSGCEAPQNPDVYPVVMGLIKYVYPGLLTVPAPSSPPECSSVPPGQVTLVTRNVLDAEKAGASYVFEIREESTGRIETSGPIPAGEKETSWTPEKVLVRGGEAYTWKVFATDGNWVGPIASAGFSQLFVRGNANGDRAVDLSDAVSVLEFLFLGGPAAEPLEAADVDSSGGVDVSDPIYLLNFLFLGGAKPERPFPEPGLKT